MKRIAGAAAALLVAALSACGGSTATPTPHITPTPSTPVGTPPADTASTSTGGLDVRYLDEDGDVKTVKVRDFAR